MLDVVTEALGRALPVAAFLLAISAVAELSDGSFLVTRRKVDVKVGGCGI